MQRLQNAFAVGRGLVTGASGVISADAVTKSALDSHTLGMINNMYAVTHA